MAEVTKALIYEMLLKLQQQVVQIAEEVDGCKREAHAIRVHLDCARENVRDIHIVLGRNDQHLSRIERRLEIAEVS